MSKWRTKVEISCPNDCIDEFEIKTVLPKEFLKEKGWIKRDGACPECGEDLETNWIELEDESDGS